MNIKSVLIFLNLMLVSIFSFASFTFGNINAIALTSNESSEIVKNESNVTINAVLNEALEYGKTYALDKFTMDGFTGKPLADDVSLKYDGSGFLYGNSTVTDIKTGKIVNMDNSKFDQGSTTVGEIRAVLSQNN